MQPKSFWVGMGALFLSSCHIDQPLHLGDLSHVSGDIHSVVLRYDPQTQDMVPEDAVLTNVLNLANLQGTHFDIFYRSTIWGAEKTSQGNLVWDIEPLSPVGLNFQKSDEQYIPTDYETFLFTTVYHHFESALVGYQNLFKDANVSCPACFRHMNVHIEPEVKIPDLDTTDNASYMRTSNMFLIPAQVYGRWVHAGMNEGVIAHEVSHALFEVLVENNYPSLLIAEDPRHTLESFLVFGLLQEGLADYFSFVITGNNNILYHSFGDLTSTTENRRLDRDHKHPINLFPFLKVCGKTPMRDAIKNKVDKDCRTYIQENGLPYPKNGKIAAFQYVLGTIVARSLVRVGERLKDHTRVSHKVLQFLNNFHRVFPQETDIQLRQVLAEIVRHQSEEDQPTVCKVFLEDYNEISADIRAVSRCQ